MKRLHRTSRLRSRVCRSRCIQRAALAAIGVVLFAAPSAHAQDAVLNSAKANVTGLGTVLSTGADQTGFDPSFGGSDIPYNSIQVNGGTVTLGSGGIINGAFPDPFGNSYALETTGSGAAAISGGMVNYDVYAYDGSTAGLTDGAINGNLNAFDSSNVTVSGGTLNGTLFAYSGSAVAVSGGTANALSTYDSSLANISGGTVGGVDTSGSSEVNIFGGTVTGTGVNALDTSTVNVTGGSFAGLDALSGTINYAGGNLGGTLIVQGGVLDVFGQFNGYAAGDTITSGSGTFTGALLYGGTQTFQYDATQGGMIEFNNGAAPSNPVPEASTTISFGLLLCLGLGGLVVQSRRRKAKNAQQGKSF